MSGFWTVLKPVVTHPLFATFTTLLLTPAVATFFSVRAFRLQSKELLDAAVTWQWAGEPQGQMNEEPFLVMQNRSSVPAFLVRVRFLKGVFFRTEAARYALSFDDPLDENFPLQVKAAGVTSFPLSRHRADRIVDKARWFSRSAAYLLKGTYLWVEVRTISGHLIIVPANEATSWRNRPRWLKQRWLEERD